MQRVIEHELLDSLPAADPRAVRARRDLRRVNAWMMNPRRVAESLLAACPRVGPRSIVELGAGDGHFLARIAAKLPSHWRGARLVLVDRNAVPARDALTQLARQGWRPEFIQDDVVEWARKTPVESGRLVVANLFLHHLTVAQLRRLFQSLVGSVQAIVACEPRRSAWSSMAVRGLGLIGCSAITRSDAAISVRAGFRGAELSSLWPDQRHWIVTERWAWPFSHLLVARRVDQNATVGGQSS